MGKVNVNGKSYDIPDGCCVTINSGGITVNGQSITEFGKIESKIVNVVVEGDVHSISTSSADITVKGNVIGNVTTASGDVTIHKDVGGSVTTASGDVECGSVHGSVTSQSGDVEYKKSLFK